MESLNYICHGIFFLLDAFGFGRLCQILLLVFSYLRYFFIEFYFLTKNNNNNNNNIEVHRYENSESFIIPWDGCSIKDLIART